jgi:hypothetical protein
LSDSDSFIQEVTEEVRRDRMFRLWRRYGPFVVAAIVAAVVAAAALAWLDEQRRFAAREAGATLLAALEAPDGLRRGENLLAAADALAGGPALAARLRAAAEFSAGGDVEAALAAYRGVADAASAPDGLAALAAYRIAVIEAERGGPDMAVSLFGALAGDGAPFRLLALEGRAAAHLRRGDRAAARADLRAILADPSATEATRRRAAELLEAAGPEAP